MKAWLIGLALLGFISTSQAQEIRFSRTDLQQELEARMPLTQQQSVLSLTLSKPHLKLLADQQRLSIRTNVLVTTVFGSESRGWIAVDGKLRYQQSDYSFYVDEPRISGLQLDGLAPGLQPQLKAIAQDLLAPALTNQPVYTLRDDDMQEALAKMMLRSITIKDDHVVAAVGFF